MNEREREGGNRTDRFGKDLPLFLSAVPEVLSHPRIPRFLVFITFFPILDLNLLLPLLFRPALLPIRLMLAPFGALSLSILLLNTHPPRPPLPPPPRPPLRLLPTPSDTLRLRLNLRRLPSPSLALMTLQMVPQPPVGRKRLALALGVGTGRRVSGFRVFLEERPGGELAGGEGEREAGGVQADVAGG